jgi:hypothetical protein
MMSGEGADPQVLDEPGAEDRGRDRWKQRLLTALPLINTTAVLVLTYMCAGALVTAWQTSDWQSFYWNTSGPIPILLALSQYSRFWPDTSNEFVAAGASRQSGSTSEPLLEYPVSPAEPQPSTLEKLTETTASIICLSLSVWSRPDVWKRWKRTILYGPLIVVLLLYASAWGLRWVQHGGNWGIQQVQIAFDGGLASQIHAQAPLYSDALAADDGQWPVHPATDSAAAYGYADGEYEISGGSGVALLSRAYNDVAVEATVYLDVIARAQGADDPTGQAGLIVRAASGTGDALIFSISRFGDWSLVLAPTTQLRAGQGQLLARSDPYVLLSGAEPHRLLVLMRGSEYTCFVNDQPVAIVDYSGFSSRQVGLWLGKSSASGSVTEGYYSHFAVYPAV